MRWYVPTLVSLRCNLTAVLVLRSTSLIATCLAGVAAQEPVYWHTSVVKPLGRYPGYDGPDRIIGDTQLHFGLGGNVTLYYDLAEVDPACSSPEPGVANSCGIHIHEGTSCDDATKPGGHYWDKTQMDADPWLAAEYVSVGRIARGEVYNLFFGFEWREAEGKVFVVHDRKGGRVTCQVIPPAVPGPGPGARASANATAV
jgi:hypothetical protein